MSQETDSLIGVSERRVARMRTHGIVSVRAMPSSSASCSATLSVSVYPGSTARSPVVYSKPGMGAERNSVAGSQRSRGPVAGWGWRTSARQGHRAAAHRPPRTAKRGDRAVDLCCRRLFSDEQPSQAHVLLSSPGTHVLIHHTRQDHAHAAQGEPAAPSHRGATTEAHTVISTGLVRRS